MSGRAIAVMLAVGLAVPSLADEARKRDTASPSPSAPEVKRPTSPNPDRPAPRAQHPNPAGPSHPSAKDRPGRSQPPAPSGAELRHPRAGTGRLYRDPSYYGHRGGQYRGRPHYYGYPYYWSPYDGYYDGYSYAYYGSYPYSYGYWRGFYRRTGSLRLLVEPERTRVSVDGYYAGVADDFDGIFQRLQVSPGRHVITLELEGYRTRRFRVYVPLDHTIKIHHEMVRGAGEDEVQIGDPGAWADEPPDDRDRRAREDDDRDSPRWERRDPDVDRGGWDDDPDRPDWRRPEAGETGTLRLHIEPPDASVYVDGEFRGTGREARRIELTPGPHRLEVVRPGYRAVEREIEVEAGRFEEIDIELERP